MAGALIIGMIIAVVTTNFNWEYTAFFAVGAFAAVILVNLRGLYLTVASVPLLFGIITFFTGWGITAGSSAGGAVSKTALITAGYPLIERFPSLLIVTLACALIAVVRLWLGRRSAKSTQDRETATRRATAEADRRNRESASRARKRSGTLTVAEIAARNKAETTGRVRTGERDRDARRREQAAERAAQERIEQGLPARDALEREHAERVARARARREAEAAAQEASRAANRDASSDAATPSPSRPDPRLRAGDPAPRHSLPSASTPESDNPSSATTDYVGKRRRLDEDLYSDD